MGSIPGQGTRSHMLYLRVHMLQLRPRAAKEICATAKSFSHVWLFVTPWTVAPPGSSVCGILKARILEWVAIPFSEGSSWPWDQTWVSWIAGKFFTIWDEYKWIESIGTKKGVGKTSKRQRRFVSCLSTVWGQGLWAENDVFSQSWLPDQSALLYTH